MQNSKFKYHLWFKKLMGLYIEIYTYDFICIGYFLENTQLNWPQKGGLGIKVGERFASCTFSFYLCKYYFSITKVIFKIE